MKKGLSLVEVLIAVAIFAIVAVISSNILIDIVDTEKKTSIQNAIYEDLRMILQQLTNEIQNGSIDYEEYYNYYVIQDAENTDPSNVFYGMNYGVYGSRFYDPGKSLYNDTTFNPADLGVECSYPNPLPPDKECEIIYSLSLDLNTGENPFAGNGTWTADESNAFCEGGWIGKCDPSAGETDHLFLIDNSGTKKTIISIKKIDNDDQGIGLVRMDGKDLDQNGLIDTFFCSEGFNCVDDPNILKNVIRLPFTAFLGKSTEQAIIDEAITLPQSADLDNPFLTAGGDFDDTANFVPISPLRSDIQNLKFTINPLEDPYKAYAEPNMQSQPTVTILLTIGLSEEAEKEYPGTFEPITVQTTVAAGVIGEIDSYPPVDDINKQNDPSWILDVIPDLSVPPVVF